LSDSLQALAADGASTYATALVIGFDSSSDTLIFTSAGHPPPLWYRAAERRWELLQKSTSVALGTQAGLPIGLGLCSRYDDIIMRLGAGDLLVCYTDGLSDSTDDMGLDLGADGLLELARGLSVESPMAAGATLLGLVDAFRRGAPAADDETLVVLQRSSR
jgi:serine phosphatase RsbU (regulator of sigma subunit)